MNKKMFKILCLLAFCVISTCQFHIPVSAAENDNLVTKIQSLERGDSYARSLDSSSDNKYLATGHDDGTVKLWNLKSFKQLAQLKGHTGKIAQVKFSPDNKIIAVASIDSSMYGHLKLWNVETGSLLKSLDWDHGRYSSVLRVSSLSFSPDGKSLAIDDDNGVTIWDVNDGKQVDEIQLNTISYAMFHPVRSELTIVTRDGNIQVRNASSFEIIKTLAIENFSNEVVGTNFTSDGTLFYLNTTSRDQPFIFNANKSYSPLVLGKDFFEDVNPGSGSLTQWKNMFLSPDQLYLVRDGDIFNFESGQRLTQIPETSYGVTLSNVSQNFKQFVDVDSSITIYDLTRLPQRPESIEIKPVNFSMLVDNSKELEVIGTFKDGSKSVIDKDITWATSSIEIANIDDQNTLHALSQGSVVISAEYMGRSSSATFHVYENELPINVSLDGNTLTFEQSPVIKDGATLVPLRKIFEAQGAKIDWNDATRTVTAKKGSVTIVLTISSQEASVNSSSMTLDVPAQIINGSTMVPARFVSEALGGKVEWDSDTHTVIITTTK